MKQVTEREIIRTFTRHFAKGSWTPLGYDEDVAAIPLSRRSWIITKTDMLVGSTDVPPGMTLEEAATKSVVSTVSDFASKGVQPRALMVSVGLPGPAEIRSVQMIARSLARAAEEYRCKIIGGDTNQANDLVIDVLGVGMANPNNLIRRNGAKVGDIVAVTGPFGKTASGLRILKSGRLRRTGKYPSLVRAVRRPKARLSEGIALGRSHKVTSSIDSSDGLAWSLHQIAHASQVGIRLNTIPIAREVKEFAREKRLSATELALYGGEEYELVITVRPEGFPSLRKQIPTLRTIGIVETGRHVMAQLEGKRVLIKEKGWEHFA